MSELHGVAAGLHGPRRSPRPAPALRPSTRRRGLALVALAGLAACGGGGGGGGGGGDPGLTPNSVDVTVDLQAIERSWILRDETFAPTHCAVIEGATQPGLRRLLRFDTIIINMGQLHLTIGDPDAPEPPIVPGDFEFAPCHDHHHFTGWSTYELRTLGGALVAEGHKQAFCLLDTVRYVFGRPSQGYDCHFQGLSSGWGDEYDRSLDGQWVDVTGVPAGTYRLVVSINVAGKVAEANDVWPNTAEVMVTLPDPSQPLP